MSNLVHVNGRWRASPVNDPGSTAIKYESTETPDRIIELDGAVPAAGVQWRFFLCDGLGSGPANLIDLTHDPFGEDVINYLDGPAKLTRVTDGLWHHIRIHVSYDGTTPGNDNLYGRPTTFYNWQGEYEVDGVLAQSFTAEYDGENGSGALTSFGGVIVNQPGGALWVDNLSMVGDTSLFSDFESGFGDYSAHPGSWILVTSPDGRKCMGAVGFDWMAVNISFTDFTCEFDVRGIP